MLPPQNDDDSADPLLALIETVYGNWDGFNGLLPPTIFPVTRLPTCVQT